ncbi:MAG TPA: PEP-CTERM sorting domain-containing protein [Candidatus Dormibacteraeota bacterium]|nr:PEP-CTERM sorting domain-containing protein [Candidatus Dormibacteraeota bacterium]
MKLSLHSVTKLRFVLGLSALALALSSAAIPAAADSVTMTGVGGANQGGVYVVPYYLSVNGGASIVAMCDDYDHHVFIGQHWDATASTFADLSHTRWGLSQPTKYKEAAWLFSKYFEDPSRAGDINFAVWALFSANAASSSGFTTGSANWLSLANTAANNGFAGFDFSSYQILTPNYRGTDGPQEYITKVPEPGTFVLLALGLMMLAFLRKDSWTSLASRKQI